MYSYNEKKFPEMKEDADAQSLNNTEIYLVVLGHILKSSTVGKPKSLKRLISKHKIIENNQY